MALKRMRLSQIFPEIKKAARQRARFEREAAKIDSFLSVNEIRVARNVTRSLIFTVIRDFEEYSRRAYLSQIHSRWGSLIDVGGCVDEYRYKQEAKAMMRSLGRSRD
jgi:hypothetical protein